MPIMTAAVLYKPLFAAIKIEFGSNWTIAIAVEVVAGGIDVHGNASLDGGVSSHGNARSN